MDILIILFIVLMIVTVVGHLIWVALARIGRWLAADEVVTNEEPRKPSNLEITEHEIARFYSEGKLNDETFQRLMKLIRAERADLAPPPVVVVEPKPVVQEFRIEKDLHVNPDKNPVTPVKPPPSVPRPPRRSFSEVLNAFMEESNIRWGEIIGGLLIIGCSTALVVSLWAQISQIPVLKFLIFTTVTAILFGIGLYTEHRWKLPTTSRGILTIATLLVPLNFLAIAAVSSSNTSGALVIGSELAAPAIFLCLVYFAGRVITPRCAHVLSAGVLGSSVGQLLVRHFASLDADPALLIFLGAFPVLCYVVTVGLALRFVLSDREIDERETTTVFTMLGTMSFAALLPFGLLLYKSGPLGMSMMYLAPIVTLWGLPLVATGTILWKRITNKDLVASRTTGTALGILGLMIVLAGMILAWPNPSSIVPAALLNFAIFTVLAVALEIPVAHVIAAICFALFYLVTFHVFAGSMTWVNLRVMSLLKTSLSVTSGQALVGAFALFVAVSEWLSRQKRERDSVSYLVSACLVALVSLALALGFGIGSLEYYALWIVLGLYSVGAFWIAWRRELPGFTWVGTALMLFALAHGFGPALSFSFPWQTALFAHATICAVAAIACSRYKGVPRSVLSTPFNYSALISIVLGVVSLFQANTWEVTWMQAQRVAWIAGILLLLLWLNRRRLLFNAFQIALIGALVLTVKAALQQFDWYEYLPHAFLRPAALQIQGTVLALFCLALIAARLLVKRMLPDEHAVWRLFDTRYSVDRLLVWVLIGGFVLLASFGALSGVISELGNFPTLAPIDMAGFPHQEAFGAGSWVVLGLLTLAMLASFWERRRGIYLLGALIVVSTVVPLLAGPFETQMATASAWRWLAAAFLLAGSLLFWYRDKASRFLTRVGWPNVGRNAEAFVGRARMHLISLTVLPVLVLTVRPAMQAMHHANLVVPASALPLVIVALIMIGYALKERMLEFAFYAGVLLNVTTAFMLRAATGEDSFEAFIAVFIQLNALTFAVYALVWLSTRRRWLAALNEHEVRFANFLLKLQVGIAVVLNLSLLLPVAATLIVEPQAAGAGTVVAGSVLGWATLAAASIGVAWLGANRTIKLSVYSLLGLLLSICCLVAFGVTDLGGWFALHILTVCVTLAAWLMLGVAEFTSAQSPFLHRFFDVGTNWQRHARHSAAIASAFAVFLSLRTLEDAEASHWWSIGPLLAISVLCATLNWKTFRRRYIYAAGVVFSVAFALWWTLIQQNDYGSITVLLPNLVAASLSGIVWLYLELRARKQRQDHFLATNGTKQIKKDESSLDTAFSFHHFVAVFSLGLFVLFVIGNFFIDEQLTPLRDTPGLAWTAFFSLVLFMSACLWDRHAKYAVVGLYSLGITGCAIALHQLELSPERLAWSITIVLAAYTVCVALLWRSRQRLISFAQKLGVPARIGPDATALAWLSVITVLSVGTIATLAYWIDTSFLGAGLRVSAALALLAQVLAFALLAEGKRASQWKGAAIIVFVAGAVLFGWSWLTPGDEGTWLNRSVILMLEVFGLTAVYGLLLDKAKARFPDWTTSARACVPWLIGIGVLALLFCLQTEIVYQLEFGAVQIHPLSLAAIALTLCAAVVTCVLFALSPNHDPLSLSERGRAKYVYVAEAMLALLFLHIRLTMPWLFTGFIERYWPLVIMAIAYFGVTASEALRRRKLLVLAQPLERTGAFLPLLPVLGFWFTSSEVDFSLLLFIVGGLYGLLSILRRSFVFGLMAGVAGNAGLWYMWNRMADYQFLQHPQLWLIPVALSALIAAYLNEDKLSEDQLTGVRYLSLVTIYVSSTADIFINGVANSPWLPLILGAFSLAGVFAGIVFRIRGLLLLGALFLLLSIVTMIWYASANFGWTWLWYVAGIVTGATIIFMFAVFEKKRGEVLRVVEGLKDWER